MSYDLMFKKANDLYENNLYDEAEQIYRCILETAPDNPDVLNMMGLTAQAKGLHNQAISYFSQAIKSAPKHLPLYFNLAVSYQSSEKYIQALESYNKVIELNPNIKEAYNNLGEVYEKLHQPKQALNAYNNALKLDENYVTAHVNIALLTGNTHSFEELNQKFQNSSLIHYYLSQAKFNDNDLINALDLIKIADSIEPNSYQIKLLKAKIFLALEKYDLSKQAFNETLDLNPKCIDALLNLATLENHEIYYLKVLDIDPNNLQAHSNYANLLYKQNRPLEALEEYRKAVILNPDLPELSNNLALILKDMGQYEQALDLMLNAFLKDKNQKDFWINIAETLVLLYKTKPQEALKIAQTWEKLAPDNIFAKHILASFKGENLQQNTSYAKELFDIFAYNYDSTMQKIKYNVINQIQQLGIKFKGEILDLGCGTGAVAEKIANIHTKITGVDISENMLNIAKQKNIYNKLIQSDIIDFTEQINQNFDFVIAADVFEYIPNIEKIASKFNKSTFIFNIENASSEVEKYLLTYNGRYQHNPKYIKNTLENAGFSNITEHNINLRTEESLPVEGTLFIAKP